MAIRVVGLERHIGVFASRPIKKNEELTIDYQYARVQGKNAVQQICYCGAASCQGFIGWKQTDKKGKPTKKSGKVSVVNSMTKAAVAEEFRETDCFSCQRGGLVMTCSGRLGGVPCPKVYHPRCVQQKEAVKRYIIFQLRFCWSFVLSIFGCQQMDLPLACVSRRFVFIAEDCHSLHWLQYCVVPAMLSY
jgi:hypothetical protein